MTLQEWFQKVGKLAETPGYFLMIDGEFWDEPKFVDDNGDLYIETESENVNCKFMVYDAKLDAGGEDYILFDMKTRVEILKGIDIDLLEQSIQKSKQHDEKVKKHG
jgi:hypothetical protein